jgi:preprotein translocase subunit YajC
MEKGLLQRVFGGRLTVVELAGAALLFSVTEAGAMGSSASGAGGEGSPMGLFVPLILMFAVLYFFMIRPAQKKQKQKDQMLNALAKGDQIVTSGGIHGEVLQVKENTLSVRIADGVKIEVQKGSVSTLVTQEDGKEG